MPARPRIPVLAVVLLAMAHPLDAQLGARRLARPDSNEATPVVLPLFPQGTNQERRFAAAWVLATAGSYAGIRIGVATMNKACPDLDSCGVAAPLIVVAGSVLGSGPVAGGVTGSMGPSIVGGFIGLAAGVGAVVSGFAPGGTLTISVFQGLFAAGFGTLAK